MRQQQMEEEMKRQMNRRFKEATVDQVQNAKLAATQKQKAMALDTKAEKQVTRMRN